MSFNIYKYYDVIMTIGSLRQELLQIFQARATRRYGLNDVNQLQHALQAAELAVRAGEPASLVTAALLHDRGHMLHGLGENPAAGGIDDHHEDEGARWLAERFGPHVSEPVRLHVAAKRYLVAFEPGYAGRLSEDSIRSLALQGGPMNADEREAFEREPFAEAATKLRRFDEGAKDPHAVVESFEHYLRYAEACSR